MFRQIQSRLFNSVKINIRKYCSFRNENIKKNYSILCRERISKIKLNQNIVFRRNLYLNSKEGKITVDYCVVGTTCVALLYFSLKTIFVNFFVENFLILKDNKEEISMKRKLLEELYSTFQEANIDNSYKEMDIARFDFGKDLEPSVESSYGSKFAIRFLVPFRMNCMLDNQTEEENNNDLKNFCKLTNIDISLLESSTNAENQSYLSLLADSLQLSPKARKFAQLWMVHSTIMPLDPHLMTFTLGFIPYGFYYLSEMLPLSIKRAIVRSISISLSYLICAYLAPFISDLKYREGLRRLINNECETDRQKANDIFEGAKEYFEKTEKLKQIVKLFTTNSRYTTRDQPLYKLAFSCYYSPNRHLDYLTEKLSKSVTIDENLSGS